MNYTIIQEGMKKSAAGVSPKWYDGLKVLGKWIAKHPVLSTTGALATAGAYNVPISYARGKDQTLGERFTAPTKGLIRGLTWLVGSGVKEGIGATVDNLNTPSEDPIATTKFSWKGLANTLNPVSGIMGGVDYVPGGVLKAFGEGNERAAHTAFKTGAIGLLAAGLISGYRASQHAGEMRDLKNADRPGKGLASQVSTTFSGKLSGKKRKKKQEKTAAEVMPTNNFTVDTLMKSAIPTGALLLAGALAYRGVDETMDARRNKQLDKAIAAKEDAIKNLITARARVAKGTAEEEDIKAAIRPLTGDNIYVKEAAADLVGRGVQTAGVLASAIVLASALGAYAYTSAGDENNLKYKAYKKALKEYAKNKSGMTPITIAPTDAGSYFAGIDEGEQKKVTPRQLPQLDTDALNQPISVSF